MRVLVIVRDLIDLLGAFVVQIGHTQAIDRVVTCSQKRRFLVHISRQKPNGMRLHSILSFLSNDLDGPKVLVPSNPPGIQGLYCLDHCSTNGQDSTVLAYGESDCVCHWPILLL